METIGLIIGVAIGSAIGVIVGWLIADRKSKTAYAEMQTEFAVASERARDALEEVQTARTTIQEMRGDQSVLQQDRASLEARLAGEKQQLAEARDLANKSQTLMKETHEELKSVLQERSTLSANLSAEKVQLVEVRDLATRVQTALKSAQEELNTVLQERSKLNANLEAEKKSLADQREQLSMLSSRLREAFAELSGEALKQNTSQFMILAEQKFKTLQTEAAGSLEQKKAEMAQLLQPMQQVLGQYKEKLDFIEKARTDAYTNISRELASVAATQQNLSKETTQLVQALRKPQGRGRWGELTLKRLFELAGMAQHVTFDEQVSVNTEAGQLRPDCVVNLPEDRQVIVDSKCVIDAFLDGSTCDDETLRRGHFARHARQVRSRVGELSSKAYWEQFDKSTDYVVLFLPGEAFLYAAVECDPELIEYALNQRVIIASPTTLLGLLKVIEHAWKQKSIEANATEIRDLGATLYERVSKMAEHFQKLGDSINKVSDQYNKTVGSLERSVLPAARRMSEMGVNNKGAELNELEKTTVPVRDLAVRSWQVLPEPAPQE